MMLKKLTFLLLAFWLSPPVLSADPVFFDAVRHQIERQVNSDINGQVFVCRGEPICGLRVLPEFYHNRDYAPVWFDADGLRPAALSLMQAIRQADRDGLTPSDYHLTVLDSMLRQMSGPPLPPGDAEAVFRADFDLMLTDAFLLLGSHLSGGRINPENLHADWVMKAHAIDMLTELETAVTREQIAETLSRLSPGHRGYLGLKDALHRLREVQNNGGWPRIEDADTIRPGDHHAQVDPIRKLLRITGDLSEEPPSPAPPMHYDAHLAVAVQKFQKRHGLVADGIIGAKTRHAMSVPAGQRIRQIELNLERWRWLPRDLGQRHIAVNIADFSMQLVENRDKAMEMRVVVGRPARRTPVFSTTMSYLELNPYWTIPHTIAVEDILPKLAAGTDYLVAQKIKVFSDWREDAPEIDPRGVPWQDYGKSYFPVRLRQDPGKTNALGQIKFIFPNKFAVYLHDTPQRDLFNRSQRDFSSGCIRLQDARALAVRLLSDDPQWSGGKLGNALESGQRRLVRLPSPIAVHIFYMTAWVDEGDALQFRADIYDRDRDLNAALLEHSPYPLPDQAHRRMVKESWTKQ